MTHLSDETATVVSLALIDRRRELQQQEAYWRDLADARAEALTRQNLNKVEAAIIELDRRGIPWLHMHPDCCDLFGNAKIPAPAGAAA
ncbi:hypothetical protein [Massilia sp. DD77]|uniref:hypothetical protein n=1 Tax=Massilia sp. DD77 TaxID=3109349 RepID=UPI002FFEA37E